MDLELAGKAALVTGGSRGIGKAIARTLAREGADVAITARNRDELNAAAEEISAETGRAILPVGADIASKDQVDTMIRKVVSAFGRLDILVNNAGQPGGLASGPLPQVTDEAMLEDLNVKYLGALRCSRAAAPFMERQGWGRIINIGGLSARGSGTYSTGARNIAIAHLTKTLADELGQRGITVNVIHPGPTHGTGYVDAMVAERAGRLNISGDEAEKQAAAGVSIRRFPDVQEIADLVAFLASPRSGAVTGESIGAGGGSSRAVYI